MNKFQKFMTSPENIHIIWEIINAYLPDLKRTYVSPYTGKEKQVIPKVYCNYDWVCIEVHKQLSVGITFQIPFHGTGYKLIDFESLLFIPNNFRIWQFAFGNINEKIIDINEIVNKYNIPKPTGKEMLNYYYKD